MFNVFTSAEAAITDKLLVFAVQPLSVITIGLASVASSLLLVWMTYRAYLVMAGFSTEPFLEILRDLFIKIFFLTFATSVAFYVDFIFTPLTATSEQLGAEIGGHGTSSIFGTIEAHFIDIGVLLDSFVTSEEPPQSALDQATEANGGEPVGKAQWVWLNAKDAFSWGADKVTGAVDAVGNVFELENLWRKIMMFIIVMIMWIGLIIFGLASFISLITNKLFFMLALGFGPIFIFLGAFNNTRNYFFSWLSTTLGYALTYALIMAVVSICMLLFKELFISDGLSYLTAVSNLLICLIFSIIVLRIGDLASAFFGVGNMADGTIATIGMVAKKALGGMRGSSAKSKTPSKSSLKKG